MVAVPEEFLKSVVFLCVDEPDEDGIVQRIPKATGFFVRVPLNDGTAGGVDYLVTARHCIEAAVPYEKVFLRWNKKAGSFIDVPTLCTDWFFHYTADVAAILLLPSILPAGVQNSDFDTVGINVDRFVGPSPDYTFETTEDSDGSPIKVESKMLVGLETYFLGLFSQSSGIERALPVAKFGHISRMPSMVDMKHGDGGSFQSEAYLMEFQSWGGHSGSPVFFLNPTIQNTQMDIQGDWVLKDTNLVHFSGLMGVVSGHFEIPQSAVTTEVILETIETRLNSGIAIVTPADTIRNLIMREDVVEDRSDQVREFREFKKNQMRIN